MKKQETKTHHNSNRSFFNLDSKVLLVLNRREPLITWNNARKSDVNGSDDTNWGKRKPLISKKGEKISPSAEVEASSLQKYFRIVF